LDLKNLTEPLSGIIIGGGRAWALMTMIVISVLTIVDKLGIDRMRPEIYLIVHTVFTVVFYAVYILIAFDAKSVEADLVIHQIKVTVDLYRPRNCP
jgi:uncharacterized membrane protein